LGRSALAGLRRGHNPDNAPLSDLYEQTSLVDGVCQGRDLHAIHPHRALGK
jgi:hypothetical protein